MFVRHNLTIKPEVDAVPVPPPADLLPKMKPLRALLPAEMKPPRKLRRFSVAELHALEVHFKRGDLWPSRETRVAFAKQFQCNQRKVQVWFQNERAKMKLQSSTQLLRAKEHQREERKRARKRRLAQVEAERQRYSDIPSIGQSVVQHGSFLPSEHLLFRSSHQVKRRKIYHPQSNQPQSKSPQPLPATNALQFNSSRLLSCEYCGLKFQVKTQLLAHVARHIMNKSNVLARQQNAISQNARNNIISDDQITLVSQNLVRSHSRGVKSEQSGELNSGSAEILGTDGFPCTQCDQRFSWKSQLLFHLLTHSDDRPQSRHYKCLMCSRIFTRQCDLTRHVRAHCPNPRQFQCISCGQKFFDRCVLDHHLRIQPQCRPDSYFEDQLPSPATIQVHAGENLGMKLLSDASCQPSHTAPLKVGPSISQSNVLPVDSRPSHSHISLPLAQINPPPAVDISPPLSVINSSPPRSNSPAQISSQSNHTTTFPPAHISPPLVSHISLPGQTSSISCAFISPPSSDSARVSPPPSDDINPPPSHTNSTHSLSNLQPNRNNTGPPDIATSRPPIHISPPAAPSSPLISGINIIPSIHDIPVGSDSSNCSPTQATDDVYTIQSDESITGTCTSPRGIAGSFRINGQLLECYECGRTFSNKQSLMDHLDMHSDENSLKCDECGRGLCFEHHPSSKSKKVNMSRSMPNGY
eukprot:847086_1